jgi:hypothetical protein
MEAAAESRNANLRSLLSIVHSSRRPSTSDDSRNHIFGRLSLTIHEVVGKTSIFETTD